MKTNVNKEIGYKGSKRTNLLPSKSKIYKQLDSIFNDIKDKEYINEILLTYMFHRKFNKASGQDIIDNIDTSLTYTVLAFP